MLKRVICIVLLTVLLVIVLLLDLANINILLVKKKQLASNIVIHM